MKPNAKYGDITFAIIESDAGYIERLRIALAREKTTSGALQAAFANRGREIEMQWRRIEAQDLEIVQLKAQVEALAAQAEQAGLLEQQLEAADLRVDELEAENKVLRLRPDSKMAVINSLRAA